MFINDKYIYIYKSVSQLALMLTIISERSENT